MPEVTLTRAQYDALRRIEESMRDSDVKATRFVRFARRHGMPYVRVTWDAGWGTTCYDIDDEGNSEHVPFGDSPISMEADEAALRTRGGASA